MGSLPFLCFYLLFSFIILCYIVGVWTWKTVLDSQVEKSFQLFRIFGIIKCCVYREVELWRLQLYISSRQQQTWVIMSNMYKAIKTLTIRYRKCSECFNNNYKSLYALVTCQMYSNIQILAACVVCTRIQYMVTQHGSIV